MKTIAIRSRPEVIGAENKVAAFLSIVPGLGHIYKGHLAAGFIWMFFGMPLTIWIALLLGLATAGIGLLFPVACWVGLAFDAYCEPDLRKHHWLMPTTDERDEEDLLDD